MTLTAAEIREHRLAKEREWYLSEDGFIDFVRDCGAAPHAQFEPHGKHAPAILRWEKRSDPEALERSLYFHKLVLWPRGSFKSSVFNIGLVCWEIARNPNIRIIVCSETGKQAAKLVDKAKEIIDSPWFRERFGVHRGAKWTAGAFVSALRTATHIKEPTLQAAGVGEVWTGSHWDLGLLDDVVSRENTKTAQSIESTIDWLGEIMAQLDPGCRLMVLGTLHHYADMYCVTLKDPRRRAQFQVSVHAWKNEDGSLFFPGRLTHAFVEAQRGIMSRRMFACFYENKPYAGEDQMFRPEYFHVIKDEDIPTAVWSYILTDFAFIAEEKKTGKADRTVFAIVSFDCNRVVYVRDFFVGRWKPSDSVRIACDLWNRYQHLNLKGMAVERSSHTEVLSSLFEEIRRQTFIRPRIIAIEGRNQATKDMRIESLEPRFRRGDIYFAQSIKQQFRQKWKPLVDEMVEWPRSQHDDIPDTLSDIDYQDSKTGKLMLPAPPPGWRAAVPVRTEPSIVDGNLNPRYGYPAELHHRHSTAAIGHDLWRPATTAATQREPSPWGSNPNAPLGSDLFRRR